MNFMGLVRRVRGLFINNNDVGKVFGVKLIQSEDMNNALKEWDAVSRGQPPWLRPDDDIDTINIAKHIADTRAKLTTLDIGIAVSGSARADYLQIIVDDLLKRLPDKVAEANRLGGMMIKFNGLTWDFILPGDFGITSMDDNGEINGAVFAVQTSQRGEVFTRLEYHRFENDVYRVTNKAFVNVPTVGKVSKLGDEVPLTLVEDWKKIRPESSIANLNKPLFAYFRLPGANTVDSSSPLGMSVFSNAVNELKSIDVAISRKNAEVEDSKHITFVGQVAKNTISNKGFKLPRFIQGLGVGTNDGDTTAIHEHTATLLTEQRIKDINFNLSMAGVKCGFSEGVFVLDGQTGMMTATQVESDDRDTIQTIKADRDALQAALEQAVYGADAMATLLELAPFGDYKLDFSFGDITYSYEEDKLNWKSYAQQGWIPKWLYLVKFEKMSEEEAKEITAEAEKANMQAMDVNKGLF